MKHPSRRDFSSDVRLLRIAAIAAGIGAFSTLAAHVLLMLIRFFTNLFFYQTVSLAELSPAGHTLGAWVIAVPVIGGLVIGLIARFGTEQIRGHGIPEAIEAILFKNSAMSPKVAVLKPLASGIAIGSGGPFGAEGPIIMTGGAIGSLIAQHVRLTGGERKSLLVAGAVSGMTAVFGTPVAAVLMAVELLLFELRPRSLLPVAAACAVAGFLRPLVVGGDVLFPLQTAPVAPVALLSCLAAGLLCGALAWFMSTTLYKVEDWFHKLPLHWMWWPALGGLAVGIGGWFQPRALGVGYDVIGDLLHNGLAVGVIAGLLAVKLAIWLIALGSGTSGGVLAPLLMLGAGLGALLAPWLPGAEPGLWPLVFMAATLGGMMRAPVMATVFAFELTHDANALLPLLAASAAAYGFTVLAMGRSILTEKIARRGHHIYREYGIDPLERHSVGEVMTAQPDEVSAAAMFAANPSLVALPHETCRAVASRLAVHGLEWLPVVSEGAAPQVVGSVSRSDLIKATAGLHVEEHERRALRRHPFAKANGS